MAPSVPLALSPCLPSELLTWILTYQTYPTTLIICSTRPEFLSSVLKNTSPKQTTTHQNARAEEDQPPNLEPDPANPTCTTQPPPPPPAPHRLLIPTLRQVSTSRHVELVFIPTVSHLRAYLSVFPSKSVAAAPPSRPETDKPGTREPLVVVYGMIALHKDTSEWNVQGFGSTASALVEAGLRGARKIVLLEMEMGSESESESESGNERLERGDGGGRGLDVGMDVDVDVDMDMNMDDLHRNPEDDAMTEDSRTEAGTRNREKNADHQVWQQRMPMLHGSTRRAGLGSADEGWSGRTVEVGAVLGRWFRLGKGDWQKHV